MNILNELKPQRVFHYFGEIVKIPRCSGEEKEVSDYLKGVGESLGLETIQDELNNIIIRKPATKGYEDSPGVIIQGHMDMVCEKEEGVDHDFAKDPIEVKIEEDFVKAKGTTLGADNGIAVAMGLAILEDDTLEHPPLELLVTISEETEMDGALGLKAGLLKGKRLLNVDSEEEGFLTVGSAGGELIQASIDTKKEKVSGYKGVKITVKGLSGGHSGMEIDKNRANALKIALQVLKTLKESLPIRLISINGGSKDNAIPRQAEIILGVKDDSMDRVKSLVKDVEEQAKSKFKEEKPEISLEEVPSLDEVLAEKDLENTIYLLDKLPTGVNTHLEEDKATVESSSNLAIVDTHDDKIDIYVSTRSSNEKVFEEMRNEITKDIEKVGKYKITGNYPGWEYNPESELRDKAVDLYKDLYNKEMQVSVIHAGLESGALKQTYKDLDIISFGPNMFDVHTPKEKLSISSTQNVYHYLVELLRELK